MRIGLDTSVTTFNDAGTARYSTELLNALRAYAPDDIEIVELKAAHGLQIPKPGVIRKMFVVYWEFLYCARLLPILAKRYNIDLLHCTSPMPLRGISANEGIKVITTVFDVIPFTHPELFTRIMGIRLRKWIRHAVVSSDHLITISRSSGQDLCGILKIPNERVTVTYPGASIPPAFDRLEVDRFILIVGTLEPRKNVTGVIEAYHLLKQKGYPLPRLVIAGGKGWGDVPLATLIRMYNLESDVQLLGFVPDSKLFSLYRSAEMLVYPSQCEGFGLPVLEAMACGCPVITSNTSSLPEVVGNAGIMVNPRDVQQIANAMHRVLADGALSHQMRQAGIKRASQFSWRQCALQTIEVYRTVLGLPSLPELSPIPAVAEG